MDSINGSNDSPIIQTTVDPFIQTMVDPIIPPLYRSWLHYDIEHKALVCVKCENPHAITRPRLRRHLRDEYKLKKKDYQPILDCIADLPIPDSLDGLPPVSDGLPARQGLAVIPGFRCTSEGCQFRTSGWMFMKKHLSMNHRIERRHQGTAGFENVSLQAWGRNHKYWIVDETVPPHSEARTVTGTEKEGLVKRVTQAQATMEKKRQEGWNILKQSQVQDSTPWLDFTKWKQLFLGKDIVLISESRLIKTDSPRIHDLFRISPKRLQFMCNVLDTLLSRCTETLETTPEEIRDWLNSPKRTDPGTRTFELGQTNATFKRYITFLSLYRLTDGRYAKYWKDLLCLCLRVAELTEDERMETYGIEFTEEQLHNLQVIYNLCEEQDEGDLEWGATNIDPRSALVENLFRFITSLLRESFPDGDAPASPLCYYAGVLGIDRNSQGFRTAYTYTTHISGFLWMSRLFMLEYALPKYRYEHIGLPDRTTYNNRAWRMESIRREHMIEGSYSPISRMINLLRRGKKFAMKEGIA